MGQYCDASQYIMFQYVYQYCKLSIEASIYQCIAMYWSIKCSVKSIKIFKMTFLVENTKKSFYTVVILLRRLYHCFWVLIIEMLRSILVHNNVSSYRDTFGVMHWYLCTLYRPISNNNNIHTYSYIADYYIDTWIRPVQIVWISTNHKHFIKTLMLSII